MQHDATDQADADAAARGRRTAPRSACSPLPPSSASCRRRHVAPTVSRSVAWLRARQSLQILCFAASLIDLRGEVRSSVARTGTATHSRAIAQ